MRAASSFTDVLLHRRPVDGRKQINGLATIVETAMGQNPVGTYLFLFISKRRDLIKALYWDRSGFALWIKKLEKDKFKWPLKMDGEVIPLSTRQLTWLLDGLDIMALRPHQDLDFSPNLGDRF